MTAPPETEEWTTEALFPIPPSPWLGRTLRWEFTFLLVFGIAFWCGYLLHEGDTLRVGYRMDFVGIYVGPLMVANGAGAQLYDLPTQAVFSAAAVEPYKRSIMPFVYPAYVAVVLKPLGWLKLRPALEAWFLVNLIAVFWSALRLARFFGCSRLEQLAVLLIFLAWPPLQLTLIQGQMGLMPTVGFTEAFIALRSGREWRAGLWMSLGLMKPQMILLPLLWFLLRRSWRVLGAFAAVVAGLLAISIASVGFWIPGYLRFLSEYNRRGPELALYPIAMQNWRGLAFWWFNSDQRVGALVVVVGLTLLSAAGVWLVSRSRVGETAGFSSEERAGLAVAIVLGLLSSPHLYMHDWVAALPAGFVLWSFARSVYMRGEGERRATAVLWLIGLAPLVFFTKHVIRTVPTVPVFGAVFVIAAIWMLSSARSNSMIGKPSAEVVSA